MPARILVYCAVRACTALLTTHGGICRPRPWIMRRVAPSIGSRSELASCRPTRLRGSAGARFRVAAPVSALLSRTELSFQRAGSGAMSFQRAGSGAPTRRVVAMAEKRATARTPQLGCRSAAHIYINIYARFVGQICSVRILASARASPVSPSPKGGERSDREPSGPLCVCVRSTHSATD